MKRFDLHPSHRNLVAVNPKIMSPTLGVFVMERLAGPDQDTPKRVPGVRIASGNSQDDFSDFEPGLKYVNRGAAECGQVPAGPPKIPKQILVSSNNSTAVF